MLMDRDGPTAGLPRPATAHASQAGWPRGSQIDRHAAGQAADRLWSLDVAPPRRRVGRPGSRRFDQPRDGPQGAKKNGMTKRKIEYWVIPPEQDAEFVACMEEVLETYEKAYDPHHPVVCMDEQPVQLLKETRVPIAATNEHGKRVDYEYERNGTASILCSPNPCRASDKQPPANNAPKPIGRLKSLTCWTRAMPTARRSHSFATTSTHTPRERSTRPSSRRKRARTSN